jgi:FMN reductase
LHLVFGDVSAGLVGQETRVLVVGIGGTTRPDSSTEKALRAAVLAAGSHGADTVMLAADDLRVSLYEPSDTSRTGLEQRLVELLRASSGLIVASPGYHGTLSGLIKNALDYAEDLRDDDPPYLEGRAFGTIGCAGGWVAAVNTVSTLRTVAHALRAWPTPMGAVVNTLVPVFDNEGRVIDPRVSTQLELVGQQVVEFASMSSSVRS